MPQNQDQEIGKPLSRSPDGGPVAQSDVLGSHDNRPTISAWHSGLPVDPYAAQKEADDEIRDPQVEIYRAELIFLRAYGRDGRLKECEKGCVELLLKRDLPKDIRVKTLYLLSGLVEPQHSEECLWEAERVLGTMDANQSQVLREEGEELLREYEAS